MSECEWGGPKRDRFGIVRCEREYPNGVKAEYRMYRTETGYTVTDSRGVCIADGNFYLEGHTNTVNVHRHVRSLIDVLVSRL